MRFGFRREVRTGPGWSSRNGSEARPCRNYARTRVGVALLALSVTGAVAGETGGDALQRFVVDAVDANPRVLAARARVAAGQAQQAAAARSYDNPELSFDAENGEEQVRAVAVSKTLDFGGKRRARTMVAQAERLALEADYQQARRAVAFDILQGLAAFQRLNERGRLAERRVQLMSDFAAFAERRFDAGDLSLVELDLAILASVDAQMSKAMLTADIAAARQRLRSLVPASQHRQNWPALDAVLPELNEHARDRQAMLALPEVRSVQSRVDAAAGAVDLRRRERRPDPTLGLAAGKEGEKKLIGLTVSIPVPILNPYRHEVAAASAQHFEAQRQADDVMQHAWARMAGAAERYQATRGAWRDWTNLGRVSLERKTELLERLWSAGEIGTEGYLVQLQQVLDVQETAVELRYASWGAWFEWLLASGRIGDWLSMGDG